METIKPRGPRSQLNTQTCPSLIQMHSMHSDVWNVQAIREPRILGSQRCGETCYGQKEYKWTK